MRLNLKTIVATALALQNDEGLDKVSTRRLAQLLGVQSPALYRHVRSKNELLGHMAAFVVQDGLTRMCPQVRWQDWLKLYGVTHREALLRYRDSARMMSTAEPSSITREQLVPAIYHPLIAIGMDRVEAVLAIGYIAAFTLGWVSYEQNPILREIIETEIEMEAGFHSGLAAVIAGIEARFPELVDVKQETKHSLLI